MRFQVVLMLVVAMYGSATQAAGGWHLVWQDEFNGNHLNDNDWVYETGGNGWGNNELEFYTAHQNKNVRVENGHLVIQVQVENHEGRHFTSGRIHSKHAWTYGKMEARARLPAGHHLWPAFWMMPRDSAYGQWAASGEIDIMEMRGDNLHAVEGTIHYGGTAPNNVFHGSGPKQFPHDLSADYHNYAVEWNDKEISWSVDGQRYHTENIHKSMWSHKGHNPYTKPGQPFDKPFFVIFNVAVGGNFFGPGPYVTPEQAHHWKKPSMEVDYVRVYQWK